ncbi:MAG: DUF1080 domain-containing protein [Planctomycetaceae bacterium]|jgi:hypothetical protein|nr:DUF1080 domain-containing protein [Planctomycetaceae bacterium]
MKKWFVFAGMIMLFCFPVLVEAQVSDEEKANGFVSIFNGKDLSEWEGNPDVWSVQDGAIVGQTANDGPAKLTYNTFLIWKNGEVDNFIFRADIKLTPQGNSGFQYRSQRTTGDKPFRVNGYQADFDGSHTHSGILYGEGFGGILCARGLETAIEANQKPRTVRRFAESDALKKEIKVDDWNTYEITAQNFTFTNKINGHVMSIATDDDKEHRRESGIFAIQAHVGPPMKVEIKNLRLKRLEKNTN